MIPRAAAALCLAWLALTPARGAPASADETLPIPPVPPRIVEDAQYDRCLDMLPDDPSGADAAAAAWEQQGGGEPARHCRALAAIALGNPGDGAAMLDALAARSHAPAEARAELYGQASQAWTMAGAEAAAYRSAAAAIALLPEDPDLRVTHAAAAIAVGRFTEAVGDLDLALELDPKRADALTLRATAERNLGALGRAAADIERAASLDPQSAETLLERGIIRQRRGDLAGARDDWTRAEALDEDSETGDLARQNLALLEAGPVQ